MQNIKSFEIEFRSECGKILNELYNNSLDMGDTKLKRIVVKTEKRYIDYLEELNLIRNLKVTSGSDGYGIQLERKGFEVFEKYGSWENYIINVINRNIKINKAKELAVQFWWIPIAISILSLTIAIISLCKKS